MIGTTTIVVESSSVGVGGDVVAEISSSQSSSFNRRVPMWLNLVVYSLSSGRSS